ncbi:MAG: CapA family protein [Lachnospiraceae bacterium]|nr:CapA family protein [Lachnospiraceae bacterium]
MKIMFAADMSFGFNDIFAGKEKAQVAMAEPAKLFGQADFSMVNLENVFGNKADSTPIMKSGPNLISEDAFIEYIHALKPDIVGMANNHSKDYGEDILFHTKDMLSESGYTCIGAGKNIEEAYRPAKISKDGINVSIIAVCENEFGIATDTTSGTAGYRLGRVTKAIKLALEEGHKPIIYFHGGNETNPFPSPGKVELYRHFIDLGAEAVIAMHTHCPQGYEYYNGKPIVYSMGNFFFPRASTDKKRKTWDYGYLSELDISDDEVKLEIYPYSFDLEKVTMLQGEENADFMRYMGCLCQPLKDSKKIQSLFDSWCLTQGYINSLEQYKTEYFADGYAEEVMGLKNVFGCEAHNELVKNTFLMIFESRVEAARAGVEVIRKLQAMECI